MDSQQIWKKQIHPQSTRTTGNGDEHARLIMNTNNYMQVEICKNHVNHHSHKPNWAPSSEPSFFSTAGNHSLTARMVLGDFTAQANWRQNQRKTNERLEVFFRPAETSASESQMVLADFDEGIFVAPLFATCFFFNTKTNRCNIHHPNHQVWNLKFLPTSGLKDPFLAFQKHHPSYHQQATIGMAASLLGPGRFGKQLLTRLKPMGWMS